MKTADKNNTLDNWYEWLVKRLPALDNRVAEDYIKLALKEYASQREEKAFYEGYIQGQNHPDNAVNNKYDYYKQQNPLT